jgi:hypothetical protein
MGGLAVTSLIATLATGPYSIYHFNRIAFYGVAANMIAVPLTGLWIMPWAVLAVILMPFGLEDVALVPMGWGVDAIIAVAAYVAGLPNAVSVVPAMPVVGLAIVTIGGLWLCLWQLRWRLAGLPVIIAGLATILFARAPDILVSEDGRFFAVVAPDGRLLRSIEKADRFVIDTWMRRSDTEVAETLAIDGPDANGRLSCDSLGCIYRSFGRTVALVQQPMALLEDCGVADVVVSLEPVRVPCHPTTAVIDRFDLWRNGVHAIWIGEDGRIEIQSVRQMRGERPWVVIRSRSEDRSAPALPHAAPRHVERVEIGLQEELQRVVRRLDDRLSGTVEGRVEDDRDAGQGCEPPQQVMEGAAVFIDGLDAGGAVDVGDRRQVLRPDLGGEQHVRRGQRPALEPLGGALGEHGGREGAPGLAPLDAIDAAPVLGLAGIGQDGAMAEGARPDLAAALEPADDLVVGEVAGGIVGPGRCRRPGDPVAMALQRGFDLPIVDARAEIGVDGSAWLQGLIEDVVVEGECGA